MDDEVREYGSGSTVTRMKTTIELPDALADEARALAHEHGTTLRELVVEGLRSEVERRRRPPAPVDFHFPTARGEGLVVAAEDVLATSYGLPR